MKCPRCKAEMQRAEVYKGIVKWWYYWCPCGYREYQEAK